MVIPAHKYLALLMAVLLPLLASCAREPHPVLSSVPDSQLPRRVAILPFSNHTHSTQAGAAVRKMFYNFFSSLNYIDMEPSELDAILRRSSMYDDLVEGRPVDTGRLCQVTGADALIFGDVTTFGKIYAVLYSEVRAGLKARMLACPSGRLVWEYEHTSRIGEGGLSISPLGLASTAAKVLLNMRQTVGMRVIADLCMQMTSTIPNPPGIASAGPGIKVLVHNGANRLMKPGDRLKVVMIGQPGMSASWDVYPGRKGLTMEEREPGVYTGEYLVRKKDRIRSGQIIGYLKSPDGGMSRWLDVLGTVTMASPTILPSKVEGRLVLDSHSGPYVVQDTLVVASGDRLVMGPGTDIWVQGLGIVVRGSLEVKGNSKGPVHIRGQADSEWKGMIIDSPSGSIDLSYLAVTGANRGIAAKNAQLSMDHCDITGNTWGIVLDGSRATLTDSTISRSAKTGISIRKSRAVITGSAIVENASGGILVKESRMDMHGCDVFNNGKWNLKVMDGNSEVDARRNWWGRPDVSNSSAGIVGNADFLPALDNGSRAEETAGR